MFPVYASCALFGLYTLFKFFGKEYVNLVLSAYFFIVGLISLTGFLRPFVAPFCPGAFTLSPYTLKLSQEVTPSIESSTTTIVESSTTTIVESSGEIKEASKAETVHGVLSFDHVDCVSLLFAAVCSITYIINKNWMLNNLFGFAFAYNGIALLNVV